MIKFKRFVKDNKMELYYIGLLIVSLLVIGIPRLFMQYNIGIGNWDTYLYLENGRSFASMGWGDVASISPVVPYILSLLFRISNTTYPEAIFNLSVFMYILGVVSLYLIFRFKFDYKTSFTGSIIYATFTLLYSWVAIGGNDITGVSLTLMTIYLIILAHTRNNNYYYIAMPVAAYAFLSRYTAGVMLFAIFFYLIISKVGKKEFKKFIVGSIIGVISISPFLFHFYRVLGTPFPFLGQFGGTVTNTKVLDAGYLPDTMYYINHLPNYINSYVPPNANFENIVNPMGNIPGIVSYIFMALFIAGILVVFYSMYKHIQGSNRTFLTKNNRINIIITIILAVLTVAGINNVSYIITTIIVLAVLYMIKYIMEDYEIKYLNYDLLMLSLFLIYLIFQSILSTKNDRYFITALPFIAYFITNALYYIYNYIDAEISIKPVKISSVISGVIVVFLIVNSLYYTGTLPEENHFRDVEDSCKWFEETQNYDNSTIIYSDNWPAVSWYLNIYCRRGVPDVDEDNSTWAYPMSLLNKSDKHEPASYYIDTNNEYKKDFIGFSKIKRIGDVEIYQNTYEKNLKVKSAGSNSYEEYYNSLFNKYNEGSIYNG